MYKKKELQSTKTNRNEGFLIYGIQDHTYGFNALQYETTFFLS